MNNSIVGQVLALKTKTVKELREQYKALFNKEPLPNSTIKKLQERIAYRLQELAFGGLTDESKSKLLKIAEGKDVVLARKHKDLLPGTIITRKWQGINHKVEVMENGFYYSGKKYKTLSPIALDITGTKWNGKRFFKVTNG